MKAKTIKVFVLTGGKKDVECRTIEEAMASKVALKNYFDIACDIKEMNKTIYEIEVGDRVYWKQNGIADKSRIDIVTGITEDIFSDTRYKTKDTGSEKIGLAYLNNIELVLD